MKKIKFAFVLLGIILVNLQTATVKAESTSSSDQGLKIVGGAITISNIITPTRQAFEKETNIKILSVSEVKPSEILLEVMNGKADFGLAIGALDIAKLNVQKAHPEFKDFSSLVSYPIGNDIVRIYAAKQANVPKITAEQTSKLLAGDFSNWKELGGADLPIQFFKVKNSFGTWVENEILKGRTLRKSDYPDVSAEDAVTMLKKHPGLMVMLAKSIKVGAEVVAIETPVYGRPIYAYTKGAPNDKVKKFYEFVKGKGRGLID